MLQLRDYDAKADKIFVHRLKGSNSGEHHLLGLGAATAGAAEDQRRKRRSFPYLITALVDAAGHALRSAPYSTLQTDAPRVRSPS